MPSIFQKPEVPSIPIINSKQTFPIRRIYCVGRNYAAHAKEMGHSSKETPFFFSKPSDSIVINPKSINYPSMTKKLEHEVEMVIAIGKPGFEVNLQTAQDIIFGYALGIDLTKRDLQSKAKSKGRPWDLSKGFDNSAPISSIMQKNSSEDLCKGIIQLSVNQQKKQQSNLANMLWSVEEIIAELSKHIHLQAGDLIFTGTPEGVGELVSGDHVSASLFDTLKLEFTIN